MFNCREWVLERYICSCYQWVESWYHTVCMKYWSRECRPFRRGHYSSNKYCEQLCWAGCRHKSRWWLKTCLGSSCSLQACRWYKTEMSVSSWCSFLIDHRQKGSRVGRNIGCLSRLCSCVSIGGKSYQSTYCIALHKVGCSSNKKSCYRFGKSMNGLDNLNSELYCNHCIRDQIAGYKICTFLKCSWKSLQLDIRNESDYTILDYSDSLQ